VPELPEIEVNRRIAARALDRPIVEVDAPDAWYLKGGLTADALRAALVGRRLTGVRRIGKQLLLDTDDGEGPVLGLHMGMSGRLLVDGEAGQRDLVYASNREVDRWDRLVLRFADGDLRVRDARRLGAVRLDPDESRLGPDALTLTVAGLRKALGASTAPLKARLMDQARLAGVGNLVADEVLWRAALDPARPAGSLDANELRRLHRHLRGTLHDFLARGGSHTGDLMPERRPGGVCPKDGTPLVRRTIGGRTSWSCPCHQR
jgi:formamidopyrimidine-DNA glycosylase